MVYWFLKFIFGPIVKSIWVKKVEGLDNISKKGALILVANHASYLDFFILAAIIPRRIYFLTAEKFFQHPLWKILMISTAQIKVERHTEDKTETYKEALEVLKKGGVLGIFPEGRRSPTPSLQKFYPGFSRIAFLTNTIVVPIGIKGTFHIFSRYDRFPKFKKICEVRIGKPLNLREIYRTSDVNCLPEELIRREVELIIK